MWESWVLGSFAFLVRAAKLGLISAGKYSQLKRDADAQFREDMLKEEEKKKNQKLKKSGPDPYLLRLLKNCRAFTQYVFDAYKMHGFIEPSVASQLLNTQTKINSRS